MPNYTIFKNRISLTLVAIVVVTIIMLVFYVTKPSTVLGADTNLGDGITVDSTLDSADSNVGNGECDDGSGNCTLRAAIQEANSNSDTSTINFNIGETADFTNGGQDGYTIALSSSLPAITETIIINGYSQPGSRENTAVSPNPLNGTLLIEIDGSGGVQSVLNLQAGANASQIRGLVINQSPQDGIFINTVDDVVIAGNYIGTNPTGLIEEGNNLRGVGTNSAHTNNGIRVGGTSPSDRNLISGNNDGGGGGGNEGISIGTDCSDWIIQGNYIGLNAAGTSAIANESSGIVIVDSATGTDNLIGGTDSGAANVISGNGSNGISAGGQVVIQGNLVGTDYTGNADIGNAGAGIGSSGDNVVIGGLTTNAHNVVSSNTHGITQTGNSSTISNNIIGTNRNTSIDLGNTISGISIIGDNNIIRSNIVSGSSFVGFAILGDNNIIKSNNLGTNLNGEDSGIGIGGAGMAITSSATNNTIGGIDDSDGNIIAYNDGIGISNFSISIGSLFPDSNSIIGNKIHSNGGIGIDNADDSDGNQSPDINTGATTNDAGDTDTGPNDYLNFPVINSTSATEGNLDINFDLDVDDSAPNGYRVEFFANETADPSGYGEGQIFLGSTIIASSSISNNVALSIPEDFTSGSYAISATTTEIDNSTDGFGATSEFSEVLGDQTILADTSQNGADSSESLGPLADTGQSTLLITFTAIALASTSLVLIGKQCSNKQTCTS